MTPIFVRRICFCLLNSHNYVGKRGENFSLFSHFLFLFHIKLHGKHVVRFGVTPRCESQKMVLPKFFTHIEKMVRP